MRSGQTIRWEDMKVSQTSLGRRCPATHQRSIVQVFAADLVKDVFLAVLTESLACDGFEDFACPVHIGLTAHKQSVLSLNSLNRSCVRSIPTP